MTATDHGIITDPHGLAKSLDYLVSRPNRLTSSEGYVLGIHCHPDEWRLIIASLRLWTPVAAAEPGMPAPLLAKAETDPAVLANQVESLVDPATGAPVAPDGTISLGCPSAEWALIVAALRGMAAAMAWPETTVEKVGAKNLPAGVLEEMRALRQRAEQAELREAQVRHSLALFQAAAPHLRMVSASEGPQRLPDAPSTMSGEVAAKPTLRIYDDVILPDPRKRP